MQKQLTGQLHGPQQVKHINFNMLSTPTMEAHLAGVRFASCFGSTKLDPAQGQFCKRLAFLCLL